MNVPIAITLNGTADIPVSGFNYVEFDQSASYVDLSGDGIIFISDFQSTFGSAVTSKVVRLDLFIEINGEWIPCEPKPENITYVGGLLTTIRWNLKQPNITKLHGKVY